MLILLAVYADTNRIALAEPVRNDWYYFDWLAGAPYAPLFHVMDTESSLGPYARHAKTITLEDLIKMHGHACDGLVTAACGFSLGLQVLYPDGVVDRTDTGCITNNSPCFGDVAEYLTGGRIRFGTQKIDTALGNEFILFRFSTGKAAKVSLNPGIFPEEVIRMESKIRSGNFQIEDVRLCQHLQWEYAKRLVSHPLSESFTVSELEDFKWQPDAYEHTGKRGDILNKNVLGDKR